ncbi:MAG: YcfA-like protein, partial [halophilic archaeon J07HB67]
GREVAKVLINAWGYTRNGGEGSHLKLRWEDPNTGEVRTTVVPVTHDPVRKGTLQSIADDCGAEDFRRFCEELDRCL